MLTRIYRSWHRLIGHTGLVQAVLYAPKTLVLPHWRITFRHALPNVIEGKIVPVALFIGLLELFGTNPALLGALIWSLAALTRRLIRKETASGLLILTTVGLTARTIAALATGSLLVYFLQPTIATGLVCAGFVLSVVIGRPLAERLLLDVCPVDEETRAHPTLKRFFSHASLWWGFTSAANFAITLSGCSSTTPRPPSSS